MKNLKEIQSEYDRLKAERDLLKVRLKHLRGGLATVDTIYQSERQVDTLNAQLLVLTWVAA